MVTSESHQKCEGPFFRLGMFLSNAQKGIFSAVERDVLKNAEKVPLKKGVFKLSGRHLNSTGWKVSKVLRYFMNILV